MPPDQTKNHKKLLTLILQLSQEGPVTPTRLTEALGLTKQTTSFHIHSLHEQGYLMLDRISPRVTLLKVSDYAIRKLGLKDIPLLGEVAAGQPTHAHGQVEEGLAYISDVITIKPGDYALQIRGDSMIGAGILPGDTIFVRPDVPIEEGEIAVVLLPREDTATLKRWYRSGDDVVLVSENPLYPPMQYKIWDIQLQGKLIGRIGGAPARKTRQTS
ncbi:LexA family protein [Deinococcus roseus]|uniref:LexA repressor n=1 Tax=Deinococcus roseus TaxID=392414 RepID=A0ABQ2DI90_9DEIO|nr:S24 family peptidase [Deinococcus roseus]GGJ59008.1 LexA repressor [Deinococcus roseus]